MVSVARFADPQAACAAVRQVQALLSSAAIVDANGSPIPG